MMKRAVNTLGSFKPALKECWGFDCLYGTGATWAQWAAEQTVPLYFYFGQGTRPSYNGDVNGFWTEVFGTPKKPKSGPLTNQVRLAPVFIGTGVENDTIAFQSASSTA